MQRIFHIQMRLKSSLDSQQEMLTNVVHKDLINLMGRRGMIFPETEFIFNTMK